MNADPDMSTSPQCEQQQLTVPSVSNAAMDQLVEACVKVREMSLRSDRGLAPVCERQRGLLRAILANKNKREGKASSLATYVAKMGQVILDI